MIFGGIDIGRQAIKVVLIDDEKTIIASYAEVSGDEAAKGSENALRKALKNSGFSIGDLGYLVATGTGREKISNAQKAISSPRGLALGARYFYPQARTVIDIGADGFRVVKMNDGGLVVKNVENNKCASGSGIFLEEIAAALEVSLEEAWNLSFQAESFVKISSICAVFAESEVVSAVHRGIPKSEILAGVHNTLAKRVVALAKGIAAEEDVVLAGGVARNLFMVKLLGEEMGCPVQVPEAPQLIGALGAALTARRLFSQQ